LFPPNLYKGSMDSAHMHKKRLKPQFEDDLLRGFKQTVEGRRIVRESVQRLEDILSSIPSEHVEEYRPHLQKLYTPCVQTIADNGDVAHPLHADTIQVYFKDDAYLRKEVAALQLLKRAEDGIRDAALQRRKQIAILTEKIESGHDHMMHGQVQLDQEDLAEHDKRRISSRIEGNQSNIEKWEARIEKLSGIEDVMPSLSLVREEADPISPLPVSTFSTSLLYEMVFTDEEMAEEHAHERNVQRKETMAPWLKRGAIATGIIATLGLGYVTLGNRTEPTGPKKQAVSTTQRTDVPKPHVSKPFANPLPRRNPEKIAASPEQLKSMLEASVFKRLSSLAESDHVYSLTWNAPVSHSVVAGSFALKGSSLLEAYIFHRMDWDKHGFVFNKMMKNPNARRNAHGISQEQRFLSPLGKQTVPFRSNKKTLYVFDLEGTMDKPAHGNVGVFLYAHVDPKNRFVRWERGQHAGYHLKLKDEFVKEANLLFDDPMVRILQRTYYPGKSFDTPITSAKLSRPRMFIIPPLYFRGIAKSTRLPTDVLLEVSGKAIANTSLVEQVYNSHEDTQTAYRCRIDIK